MSIRSSVTIGFRRARRTPRLIVFAWIVNLLTALVVALPMFVMLDAYIGGTVHEETLMRGMDQNWWYTFKQDHPENPIVGMLDESIMGAGPFLAHTENVLSGGVVMPLARSLSGVVFGWTISWSAGALLAFLGLLAVFLNALLSAGFLSTYRGDYPPTIAEFLSDGSRHFGPFVRLALLVFLLQALVLYPVIDGLSSWIAASTENDPSEMTPFVYYMVRNIVAFASFFFVSLAGDYGRVHLVVGGSTSAVIAFGEGVRFVVRQLRTAVGVGGCLVLCTVILMAAYGLLEFVLPKDTGWMVVALLLLHQAYMLFRQFLRAATYACEVDVFQGSGTRS